MGESLRVPAGVRWGCCVRDSQRRPLRVTVTDKQVSVRHNPSSLPPAGVRDSRSLTPPRSSLSTPSLTPAGRGRQARAPTPAPAPGEGGEPEEGDKCHLLRPREELLKSSQATGSKGNSCGRAHPVTPPPAPISAQPPPAPASALRDFLGGPAAARGRGAENLPLSPLCLPSPDAGRPRAGRGRAGPSPPRRRGWRGKWQGPEGRSP